MKLQDQLQGILNDLQLAGTETSLIAGAIVLLVIGLFSKNQLIIKALFAAVLVASLVINLQITPNGLHLSNSLFLDLELKGLVSLFLLFGILLLIFPRSKHAPEFYFLILSLLIGSIFMVKSNSFLLIYLSIELVSYTSYILTGLSFRKNGFEASVKYLLFGAISSAIMLLGLGFVYGATDTFYLSEWSATLFASPFSSVGLLLLSFGLLFKSSIFPFHSWTPATYQAAPVDAVTIFSVVPKLAGLLLLRRILVNSGLDYTHWVVGCLIVLGIATIVFGTFGALKQTNVRRMVSFGSIAHSGFLFGLIILPSEWYNAEAFWWYAVVYGLMNFGVFYLTERYENQGWYSVDQYGESRSEVWMGGTFTLVLVSLVGLPPLAGFTAKLFLFSALWEAYLQTDSIVLISYLLVAVFATVASLFFYMKIPKKIFLSDGSSKESKLSMVFSLKAKIAATIFGITLLMLFFVPELISSLKLLLSNIHE